ncbi:hypothetical protein GLYMA_14G067600v4 [Glycine max]|uniref:Uncharacterized protein n=1 Tax=Glycine max TaxID=3847 RepID=A0A0R0GAD1_SOYBN|nr:hypothetical protein GYH30_039231 [Glycine max]KRH15085.1 hypothetical protein GLYMA_14G067600v4 [Glycine max]
MRGKERSERLRGSRAVNSCPNFEKALLRTKTQYILHPKSLPIFLLKVMMKLGSFHTTLAGICTAKQLL